MHYFQIHQFFVESDIILPCDASCTAQSPASWEQRLRVCRAAQPLDRFSQVLPVGRTHDSALRSYHVGDGILLCVEERIKIHMDARGETITLDVDDEYVEEAALYIVGLAMAICTSLRGGIALHASSVDIDGHRIAFLAPSGTGKSTTLWAFLEHGARFANDDLVAVHVREGRAMSASSESLYPKVGQTLIERGLMKERCHRVLPNHSKYWFHIAPEQRACGASVLSALFVLQPSNESASIQTQRHAGMSTIPLLLNNSMANLTASAIIGDKTIMSNYVALAGAVPIYTINYPKRFEALPPLVQTVRELLQALSHPTDQDSAPMRELESVIA